ncbi:MAG: tetratricopeptide repeat protein [Candidatus Promineifilaceae bacterium]|nr:tetratricopeptide repeat protein [Candidatus Promineifilaceae bacterium]
MNSIGEVYNNLGDWQKALDCHHEALIIMRAENDHLGQAITTKSVGRIYHYLGQWENALDYYDQALPIMEEVNDLAGMAGVLSAIADIYYTLWEWEKALEYYHQALPIQEELNDYRRQRLVLLSIAKIYESQNQLKETATSLRQVVSLDKLLQHPDLKNDQASLTEIETKRAAQKRGRSLKKFLFGRKQ